MEWIHNPSVMALLEGGRNFWRWGLVEEVGHWQCVLKGYILQGAIGSHLLILANWETEIRRIEV
jgi:hypothetical protein